MLNRIDERVGMIAAITVAVLMITVEPLFGSFMVAGLAVSIYEAFHKVES